MAGAGDGRRPPTVQRKTVGLVVVTVLAVPLLRLVDLLNLLGRLRSAAGEKDGSRSTLPLTSGATG